MEEIKIQPTKSQLKKIARGEVVQLKHSQLYGDVAFSVNKSLHNKIVKARRKDVGVRFQLNKK